MTARMVSVLPSGPFILFDDARPANASPARLYSDPLEILQTNDPDSVPSLLDRLRDGDWAGFITYEAGHALEPRLGGLARDPHLPLLWFARFQGYLEIEPQSLEAMLPSPDGGWAGAPVPMINRADYDRSLGTVLSYITAGDIYQANLTFPCSVATAGHPLAIYAGMRKRARAGYGGIVWTGQDWLLSFSPELFFALHNGKITTKPMKGTATRGGTATDDAKAIEILRSDPKQRAENLMIVDLLRNDLSRVAAAGTVDVPDLFVVETYPTVHQMTSTVTAQLREGFAAPDLLAAIYPCGSITGAPKIRAMEVIHEVEPQPRGVYTGSIGRIGASGDAAFNVAIRTLHLRDGDSVGKLGLGSGIVADSKGGEEWRECLAKGRFVADERDFDLIETMLFEPDSGIHRLERHLERLARSARTFGFSFDKHAVRNELQSASFFLTEPRRIRLLLAPSGQIAIEIGAARPWPGTPVKTVIRRLPVDESDFRLRHKCTDRDFYDRARLQSGADEVLFCDSAGFLTEGSFTNLFVERDGMLLTPPLARGLLPGVLREELIETGRACEADLRESDLVGGFQLGNASRGLVQAILA